jgi:Flp pilus assembly protein protease CpaA
MLKAMINELIMYSIAFIALVVASYTDIRTREVPDWLNYGLIGTGLAISLLFSAVYFDIGFFINSLAGLGIFFVIAWVMFYSGQWGGGDSKILMGLGALLGLDLGFRNLFLAYFFVNFLFVGAAYGMLTSVVLALRHRRRFLREYKKISKSRVVLGFKKYLMALLFVIVIMFFFVTGYQARLLLFSLLVVAVVTFCVLVFGKVVEKACMYKYVKPEELTEGDWIAKDIKVDGRYIAGPKDLGIGKGQIRRLIRLYKKNKIKRVLIKEGIPFVPSFLIAFLVTLYFGNLLSFFLA